MNVNYGRTQRTTGSNRGFNATTYLVWEIRSGVKYLRSRDAPAFLLIAHLSNSAPGTPA